MSRERYHPLARSKQPVDRHLSRDDITNQGRYLLNTFIHERMRQDGIQQAPALDELQEPGTPCGPPMQHTTEIARALRCIGDQLDGDVRLQNLISQVPPDAQRSTFLNVAQSIFSDGVFNWGRVVALFYFAYKMALKALDKIPLVRAIINLVIDFLRDKVAQWIIDRGGWEAIVEYFGTPSKQVLLVLGAGVVISGAIYLWKGWH
ncbi:apoptosis regulator BAX-like [Haliotis cracherodii]|uniref:apoptosis regulator BAX-like n=1 Tax=Haliotis cracherodii TaxID=6455 RepID=UPI001EB0A7B5|nr:apoptosis regulator BAX-like isoform X2 [Haliotis rufescens]